VDTQFLILVFLLISLGACNQESQPSYQSNSDTTRAKGQIPDFSSINTSDVYVYNCADSLQLTAHVTTDSTWLFLSDTTVKLGHVPAASGAKYQSPDYLYWSKNGQALFQGPTSSLMNCTAISKEKSWQAAKLRGVNFRALGQEPGWILEITKGAQMQYIGNYGQDTVVTPVPNPRVDKQKGITTYNALTHAHSMTIKIIDEPCTDSMSGFEFSSTVTVTVDGKTYRGCGRTLN